RGIPGGPVPPGPLRSPEYFPARNPAATRPARRHTAAGAAFHQTSPPAFESDLWKFDGAASDTASELRLAGQHPGASKCDGTGGDHFTGWSTAAGLGAWRSSKGKDRPILAGAARCLRGLLSHP